MLSNAGEWKQRFRVSEGPAPAIEADQALKVGDRFALNRLAIEGRGGKPLEPFPAPRLLPPPPHTTNDTPPRPNPKLLGLPAQRPGIGIALMGKEASPCSTASPHTGRCSLTFGRRRRRQVISGHQRPPQR
jgi:hypothetical protein